MKPVVSVKELMRDLLDPLADNIFDAVSVVIDKNGHDGTKAYDGRRLGKDCIGATTMAEASYLAGRSTAEDLQPPARSNDRRWSRP